MKKHNTPRGDFISPPHTTEPARSTLPHQTASTATPVSQPQERLNHNLPSTNRQGYYLDLWGFRGQNTFINRNDNEYNIYGVIASVNLPKANLKAQKGWWRLHKTPLSQLCSAMNVCQSICAKFAVHGLLWWADEQLLPTHKSHAI